MKTFLIDSHNGGIADYEDKGIPGSFKAGSSNLDIHKDVDSISCQQGLSDETMASGTTDSLVNFIIPSADGNTYFVNDRHIFKKDSGGTYADIHTNVDTDGDIIGAAEWYNDAGDTFFYWATSTKLHRKQLLSGTTPVNTNWSDIDATVNGQTYPKTNLTSAPWHTMREVNGVLLICNDNKLAQVGYDDSYTNNALEMIPGNRSKCLIEAESLGIIGCDRKDERQESSTFYWDGISLAWNDKKILSSPSVNALISSDIELAQVGDDGKVYYLAVDAKKPLFSFPDGGQVNPHGVDVDDGLALFGVFGNGTGNTGIYSYGSRKKNGAYVLNLEYQFDCDEIGAVKKIGTDILFSYKNGSTYGIKKVDTANKATGTYISLDLKAPADMAKEPVWGYVKLFTAPLPAGTSIELWRKCNKSGDFIKANTLDGSESFSIEDGQEAVFSIGDTGKTFEYKLVLNPNGNESPEVYREEVYFE